MLIKIQAYGIGGGEGGTVWGGGVRWECNGECMPNSGEGEEGVRGGEGGWGIEAAGRVGVEFTSLSPNLFHIIKRISLVYL